MLFFFFPIAQFPRQTDNPPLMSNAFAAADARPIDLRSIVRSHAAHRQAFFGLLYRIAELRRKKRRYRGYATSRATADIGDAGRAEKHAPAARIEKPGMI